METITASDLKKKKPFHSIFFAPETTKRKYPTLSLLIELDIVRKLDNI